MPLVSILEYVPQLKLLDTNLYMGSSLQSCCGSNEQPSHKEERKIFEGSITSESRNTLDQVAITQDLILQLVGTLLNLETSIEDFVLEGVLGAGAFGEVYLGYSRTQAYSPSKDKVAIKRIPKKMVVAKGMIGNTMEERNILAMKNKFLVSLNMAFQDMWYLYLVMEYAVGGDLYQYIKPNSFKLRHFKKQGEPAVKFIGACIVLALQFLHDRDYVYRDLKPENILIFADGYIKVADFGLAKKCTQGKKNQTISGTRLYNAPEMILGRGYNKEVDLWGFGVLLYEISNYQTPFQDYQICKEKFEEACSRERKWPNQETTSELRDLIDRLLKFRVEERIGVVGGWNEIKEHPYFNNFEWDKLMTGQLQSPLKTIIDNFPASIRPLKEKKQPQGQQKPQRIDGWNFKNNKNEQKPALI